MEYQDHPADPREYLPSEHALVVPPIGIMQILHGGPGFDPEATMRGLYDAEAPYITVRFDLDGTGGTVGFFPAYATVNARAREALRILTGIHMVLTGPAIFTGVPAETLGEVVAELSVEGR